MEVDEQEKEILLSEVVFPLSPVEAFRSLIKKEGRTVRDQAMEEDGRFILSPEYAGDFLGRNMGTLVTTFSLLRRRSFPGTKFVISIRRSGSNWTTASIFLKVPRR